MEKTSYLILEYNAVFLFVTGIQTEPLVWGPFIWGAFYNRAIETIAHGFVVKFTIHGANIQFLNMI